MLCTGCSREIPANSVSCSFCSARVLPGNPLGAMPAPPPPKPITIASKVLLTIGSVISLVLMIFLNAAVTLSSHGSLDGPAGHYFAGTIFGTLLMAGIGILILKKFSKKSHSSAGIFATFCAFAFAWSLLGTISEIAKSRPPFNREVQNHVKELAREGTGQAPISGDQDEFDGVGRSFFADMKQFNDNFRAEVAKTDHSALDAMYSAESYSSDANIVRTMQQLTAALALEDKYASMQPLIQKSKDRLNALTISETSKAEFWKGFEESVEKTLQGRDGVNEKGHVWLQSSIELYKYMQANETSFHVSNNKVIFTSHSSLLGYNERMKTVQAQRKEFLEAKGAFLNIQKERLSQLGLKPSDFDVPEGN
jgi:hypothetical protein